MKKGIPRESMHQALEKQRLTVLSGHLMRYTGEAEARSINRIFSSELHKVLSMAGL